MLKKFDKLFEEVKDELIKGGLADGLTAEDIAKKHDVDIKDIEAQIKMGLDVEKEHTDDPAAALEIALDHLFEDPKYYDKLDAMEAGKCDDIEVEDSEDSQESDK